MSIMNRLRAYLGFEPKRNLKLVVSPKLNLFRHYVSRLEEGLTNIEKLRDPNHNSGPLESLQIDGLRILASGVSDYMFSADLSREQAAELNGLFEKFVDGSRYLTLRKTN